MAKAQKNRASKQEYVSPKQLTIEGFETPFSQNLCPTNRWVVLANLLPWDDLIPIYQAQMNNDKTGAGGINPRVVIGALIIKHRCNLSDEETILQIQENIYMQYFIGYSSFSSEAPFDPSLLTEIRKRFGKEQLNAMNEKIVSLYLTKMEQQESRNSSDDSSDNAPPSTSEMETPPTAEPVAHKGSLIVDATACPQDISYPTDLNLLNDAREKTEELIDHLCKVSEVTKKPRTYRERARTDYLKIAQKKTKGKKEVRKGIKKQLGYLNRNIKHINVLLDSIGSIPFNKHQYKYWLVIQTLYEQQLKMYQEKSHSVEHRIVSIHQPHVRPIVRGKANASVEFGAKINASMMNGFVFLEDCSWDAFNEGTRLMSVVESYKRRFGYYPKVVLVDKIYCNRDNRRDLKELGITLRAKPLGRPSLSAVNSEHVRPGERNPIEGKFGQAKTSYGMNRIKARLATTSESWIATIILVLNLVKLAGLVLYSHYRRTIIKWSDYPSQIIRCFKYKRVNSNIA